MVYEAKNKSTIAAVRCPICNKRIMDIEKGTKGSIQIKCPNCKKVSRISVAFRLNRRHSYTIRLQDNLHLQDNIAVV